jgi:hypothetical protein
MLARLLRLFFGAGRAGVRTILRTETHQKFTVLNKATGKREVFRSLEEMPPELQAKFQAAQATGKNARRHVSFTFRGPDGREHTYHSVDEMPAHLRVMYEQFVLPELRSKNKDSAGAMGTPNGA